MGELESLRVFLAVAEQRSFSAAARQLSMTSASVTRAVAALEERLGVQLLLRTTRQVSLTSAGGLGVLPAAPAYLGQRGAPDRRDDLAGFSCLSYSQDAEIETWELSKGTSRRSHRAEGGFRANNGDLLARLVMNGEGIALLPR